MNDTCFLQASRDHYYIEQVIRFLVEHFREHPGLEETAASVHLSPYHFQRLFKRWAGVSPTRFQHYLMVECAKQRLREAGSVLDTALDGCMICS